MGEPPNLIDPGDVLLRLAEGRHRDRAPGCVRKQRKSSHRLPDQTCQASGMVQVQLARANAGRPILVAASAPQKRGGIIPPLRAD